MWQSIGVARSKCVFLVGEQLYVCVVFLKNAKSMKGAMCRALQRVYRMAAVMASRRSGGSIVQ